MSYSRLPFSRKLCVCVGGGGGAPLSCGASWREHGQRLTLGENAKSSLVRSCANCGRVLADSRDIFSMTKEGSSGVFVNGAGALHDIVTITKVDGEI